MARKSKSITSEQRSDIRKLTKLANQRLDRASAGQRRALEYYVNKATGKPRFSAQTKGMTYQQAKKYLEDLSNFMNAKSSTKRGWNAIKERQVRNANVRWHKMGYDLTDEELAQILEQIDTSNKQDYYDAVDKVQAAKREAQADENKEWFGTEDQIASAIDSIISAQKALIKAKQNRNA